MSEKTVAQKLGLKTGKTLAVRQQPDDIALLIGALPSVRNWSQLKTSPAR